MRDDKRIRCKMKGDNRGGEWRKERKVEAVKEMVRSQEEGMKVGERTGEERCARTGEEVGGVDR